MPENGQASPSLARVGVAAKPNPATAAKGNLSYRRCPLYPRFGIVCDAICETCSIARSFVAEMATKEQGIGLAELSEELEALARLVSGEAMELAVSDERALRRGRVVLLPARMDLLGTREQNAEAFRLKVTLAALSYQSDRSRLLDLPEPALRTPVTTDDLPGFEARIEAMEAAFAARGIEGGFSAWAGLAQDGRAESPARLALLGGADQTKARSAIERGGREVSE